MSDSKPLHPAELKFTADSPAYFIADIAANHDGDLDRAKFLIWLAKEAGAQCAKFQHFKAEKIVSDHGFRSLPGAMGHQSRWKKPVFDVYKAHELDRRWNEELAATAREAGIDFMTTPYDLEAVQSVAELVPAWKIGSGDITWTDFIYQLALTGKPVLLATGASSMEDVERAVRAVREVHDKLVVMQCNTNYTGSLENFRYINLNVLKSYAERFPGLVLGLSDHSPGHATVLGAIALGARVIEKHFTDDPNREGPDHGFSMTPQTWKEMVERSRELQAALGDGVKRVEPNETETVILQQRCIRLRRDLPAGHMLRSEDVEMLRPAPTGALRPHDLALAVGARLTRAALRGEALALGDTGRLEGVVSLHKDVVPQDLCKEVTPA